jgi:hypothetical protein
LLIGVIVLFALVAGCAQQVSGSALPSSGDVQITRTSRPSLPQSRPSNPRSTSGTASSGSQPAASELQGNWEGSYLCGQGETGLKLTIGPADSSGKAQVTFDFFPLPSNPSAATGSYSMTLAGAANGLRFTPERWIDQPTGYEMVGMVVDSASTGKIAGKITSAACSTFSVTRK